LTGWAGSPGTPDYIGFGHCFGQLRGHATTDGGQPKVIGHTE